MEGRFEGQTAVVTGAGSGIGRSVALRLTREGARVVAIDIDPERLDVLAGEAGSLMQIIVADIAQPGISERIVTEAGRVDILANVAGIMDHFLAPGDVDDGTWQRVMDVNLTAPMRLIRAVLPGMIEVGAGAIVNVASEAGLKGGCAGAAYTASKHGLIGLTKNAAFLYATKGVRVNAVAPGPVMTGLNPDFRSAIAGERIPPLLQASISRLAQPEEIASTILWLASAEAANVNGAILAVDGGWSAA